MKRIEKCSDNTLSELQSMIWQIGEIYRKYSHVSEFMPKTVKTEIDKFNKELTKENDFREQVY